MKGIAPMKVVKFGGTSLANADQARKVLAIVRGDDSRRCVFVSAPGKRNREDAKVTDLLLSLPSSLNSAQRRGFERIIISRYQEIIDQLGLGIDFSSWFDEMRNTLITIKTEHEKDFLASRGEYWMAKIMAKALGFAFVDAGSFIAFSENGALNMAKTEQLSLNIRLKNLARREGVCIPGFYGQLPDGAIKTFPRGGSDTSGAITAYCLGATLYENFTDVPGIYVAHPRIVHSPRIIDEISYNALGELAYRGAEVLHHEVIFPVRLKSIPINVRCTDDPDAPGTLIVPTQNLKKRASGMLLGIAGKKGFVVITLQKAMMNNEIGFLQKVCGIMASHDVSIEHIPGGLDTLSIVVKSSEFDSQKKEIMYCLQRNCKPDEISIDSGIALVCVVVSAMAKSPGVAAKIFKAVAQAQVNIRTINQGSSEMSIVIGVEEADYEKTIRAIYSEFEN